MKLFSLSELSIIINRSIAEDESINYSKTNKMERKINEVFQDGNVKLRCIEDLNGKGCDGCYYDIKKAGSCYNQLCTPDERSDKRNVIFIKVKK